MSDFKELSIPYYGSTHKVSLIDAAIAVNDRIYWLMVTGSGPIALVCVPQYCDNIDSVLEFVLDSELIAPVDAQELHEVYGFDTEAEYQVAISNDDFEGELSEGYHYMPNFGDTTGIVFLGYAWQLEHYDHKAQKASLNEA